MALEASNQTEPPPDGVIGGLWTPHDASLLAVIVIDTAATLFCVSILTICVMWHLGRRARRREERDKLATIIQNHYWETEEQINHIMQILTKMQQMTVFRDVTELHVFAYKYRMESNVYGIQEYEQTSYASRLKAAEISTMSQSVATVRRIERLFDMLTLQLPCRGECPSHIMSAFGSTLYSLAQSTSAIWSNRKARHIRNTVHYFAGRSACELFESGLISDEDLESLVLARIPYVHQLYLNEDRFVLQDAEISSDLKLDLKNKIRYVDTVLAKNNTKILQPKEKNITEAYYTAREICLKNSFIQNKNYLPDIVTKVGEPSKLGECVVCLRHLLRIMCMPKNLRKMENDDKFFQFLMQLHESLYTWSDTGTMVEVLERARANILCYLRGLTIEQMLIDKEFTKAKLEHLEKELYRHLNYLTLRQVQQERLRRQFPNAAHEPEPKMRLTGSDSSIYTMAMSTSSFLMHRQASADQPDRSARHHDLELLHQQASLDRSSIVSGSSLYATAMSLSGSANNNNNELVPLMRRTPPPTGSPPSESQSPSQGAQQYLGTSHPWNQYAAAAPEQIL